MWHKKGFLKVTGRFVVLASAIAISYPLSADEDYSRYAKYLTYKKVKIKAPIVETKCPIANNYIAGEPLHRCGSAWPLVFGNIQRQRVLPNFSAYNLDSAGIELATDMEIADLTRFSMDSGRIGIGASYGGTSVRYNTNMHKINIDSGQLFVFGAVEQDNLFVDGVIAAGYNHYKESRLQQVGNNAGVVSGSYPGEQFAGKIRVGLTLAPDLLETTPMVLLQYTHLRQHSHLETGENIIYSASASRSSLFKVGAGFKLAYLLDRDCYIPEFRLFYLNTLNQPRFDLPSAFTGAGGTFYSQSPAPSRNELKIGLGLSAKIIYDINLVASYDYAIKQSYRASEAFLKLQWFY